MANWFHRHERGRVMGVWSTNFTVGALGATAVMGLVLGDVDVLQQPWQWCFVVGAAVLTIVWIQFFFLQRTRPEDVGLAPIDDPQTEIDESKIVEPEADEPLSRGAMDQHPVGRLASTSSPSSCVTRCGVGRCISSRRNIG